MLELSATETDDDIVRLVVEERLALSARVDAHETAPNHIGTQIAGEELVWTKEVI